MVFEHEPPYRGIEVSGRALLGSADAELVRTMAVRYLGRQEGEAYAAGAADDTLVRLEPGRIRACDFADEP